MIWSEQLFGLSPEELPLAGQTRATWQQEQLETAGGTQDDLDLGSDVVVSAGVIGALLAAAQETGRPVIAAAPIGAIHEEFGRNTLGLAEVVDDTLQYDLTVAAPSLTRSSSNGTATGPSPFLLDQLLEVVSESPQPGRMAKPITGFAGDRFIWSVNHWYDLLVANLLAAQSRCSRITGNHIGSGVVIHPLAMVEDSIIEDGAVIGPMAVVRNSHVGAGTVIEDQVNIRSSIIGQEATVQTQSLVSGSVIGDGTVISFHTAIRGSLLFGQSTISCPVVARSVIGPETFLARGVGISASTLADSPIRVRVESRLVCTGARLVGCAVGRGARIGNGVTVPAGYTVPAGVHLVERPMPRIDPDTPAKTSLVLDGGRLRTLPVLKGMKT